MVSNYFTSRSNDHDKNGKHGKNQSPWKRDMQLLSWGSLTLFDEYLEMVIQFGFVTLFVVAFPLGPLFALLNNLLEIRIDAFKALTQLRRPQPRPAKDIGVRLPIHTFIAKLAVITNGAIIAFTSEFVPRLVFYYGHGQRSLEGYVMRLSQRDRADKEDI